MTHPDESQPPRTPLSGRPPRSELPAEAPPPGTAAMAWLRWALVSVMAMIALASVAYSLGVLPSESAQASAPQYYCPMHPQIVQDAPGDCPICSMSLVQKAGGKHAMHSHAPAPARPADAAIQEAAEDVPAPHASQVPGLASVELSLDRVQLIGMQTAKASLQALPSELQTVGHIALNEARLARVSARVAGWLERLDVATTGETVQNGQTLASIFSPELLPAQQEFLAARRWTAAPSTVPKPPGEGQLESSARARLELLGMSAQQIERVATTGKAARSLDIIAPMSGTVIAKTAVRGAFVQPGTELYEIADLSRVWLLASISEADIARVAVGQAAVVELEAYPGQSFSGSVSFIYPTLEVDTRTLQVRVELDNSHNRLRPGMYAQLKLQLPGAQGVVIPREALVDTGEHQYVFVAHPGGHFEPRLVIAGARGSDGVQILRGLSAGELVVTTGNFLIDSESRLRAAIGAGKG